MKRRTTRRRAKHPEPELPADEVDAFHEQNDRVMLDGADPNSEEDEDFKDPESMLDLDVGSSDSEDYDENWKRIQEEEEEEKFQADRELMLKQEASTTKNWKKNEFYDADTKYYEVESDDEAAQWEEEEATNLQKQAANDIEKDYTGMMEDLIRSGAGSRTAKPAPTAEGTDEFVATKLHSELNEISFIEDGGEGMEGEKVERDITNLTKEQKLEILEAEAPELPGLLEELHYQLQILKKKASKYPVLARLASSAYAVNIAFYLLLKSDDSQMVREHPVMGRLMKFKMASDSLNEVNEEEDGGEKESSKSKAVGEISTIRNGTQGTAEINGDSKKKKKKKKTKKAAKAEIKKHGVEKKKKKKLKKRKKVGSADVDVDVDADARADEDKYFLSLTVTDKAEKSSKKRKKSSKSDLSDYYEGSASTTTPTQVETGANGIGEDDEKFNQFLDQFDQGLQHQITDLDSEQANPKPKRSKKKKKQESKDGKKKFSGVLLNREEPQKIHADGRRMAHKRIIKNRGLTRVRNKKFRTPHLRARHKYDRAMKKRRDQVRDWQGSKAASYKGEKTGIKPNIIKSVQFK
ncbi:hypothetical protein AAMO2058_001493500 [Amorphochlora amoebiformis]